MPRKSKEEIENIENKKTTSAKKNVKSTATKKSSSSKTSKATKPESSKKIVSAKKATKSKKAVSTKSAKSTNNKSTTSKKTVTSKKASSKKSTSVKKSAATKKILPTEYYDLPQKYNKTVVKVLAQTPKTLFVYWEISDADIENFKKQYGDNFFETTKPVLIIHNDTLNYSFEVEINDFANSWYLHVNDSKSDYRIELGRRPFQINESIPTDYIYVTSSNEIESPNDHILFNNSQKMVYFRNVKTNVETSKPFVSLSFIKNMGKIYEIYDLYQELYKNEENIEDLTNPSSHTSSQFK